MQPIICLGKKSINIKYCGGCAEPCHVICYACCAAFRTSDLRKVNKRAIESLIKSGAFDTTGARRSQLLAVLDKAIAIGGASQKEKNQVSIFETLEANGSEPTGELLPDIPEWEEHVLLKNEKDTIGFYITGHPLARFEAKIRRFSSTTTKELSDVEDGKDVSVCGIITEIRTTLTKKGDKMAYVRIEDLDVPIGKSKI